MASNGYKIGLTINCGPCVFAVGLGLPVIGAAGIRPWLKPHLHRIKPWGFLATWCGCHLRFGSW